MDLIKLREIYEKIYKKIDFSFFRKDKEYTQRVINVTFKYSYKEYNNIAKNLYLKSGYSINDVEITDCLGFINGELIAVRVGFPVESPVSNDQLGKYFYYESGVYNAKTNIDTVLSVSDLRHELYENGFICDGIKYVRFARSSGSSRVGKCLFIDEKLYKKIHNWEMCGIKVREGEEIDLAALESYIALPLSSIIGTIEIQSENILVIEDYESVFEDEVIAVDILDEKLHATEKKATITNNIWDGQSLIDPSIMGAYSQFGFILLRNRMFKSACFNCNIQEWFADNGITSISQLNGFTYAKNIEEIKLITTPSSIKYLKFGTLENWLNIIEPIFGVVKHEKPTHFFNGRMVQLHYQLLNTLQLSQDEVSQLLLPSLDYLRLLKTDPAVVKYHIKYNPENNMKISSVKSRNEIIYKMLGINEDFYRTKLFHDFRSDLIESYKKNLRCGHILVNGNYSTLLGNPIEMLQSSIGQFHGQQQIKIGEIHSTRFPYDIDILGSRSPHVTMGNILITHNVANSLIDKYFNITDGIICINSINENTLSRLSGSDFDSDSLLLTDNKLLISSAKKNYRKFKVPTGLVPAKKIKRPYTAKEKARLDIQTSVNKIGEIINLSQELNTLLWNSVNKGISVSNLSDLYCDIAKLDVLSNIEIDKAKKEYLIDSVQEIKLIKQKYQLVDENERKIKPNFLGVIAKKKGYYNNRQKNYKFHLTTMDYVQHAINAFRLPTDKDQIIPFSKVLVPNTYNYKKANYKQIYRIASLIRETNRSIKYIWNLDDATFDKCTRHVMASEKMQECVEYISKIKLDKNTMYYLLKSIESEKFKDIYRITFYTLFSAPNKSFFDLIKSSSKPIFYIKEDLNGTIKIYDFYFSKNSEIQPKKSEF